MSSRDVIVAVRQTFPRLKRVGGITREESCYLTTTLAVLLPPLDERVSRRATSARSSAGGRREVVVPVDAGRGCGADRRFASTLRAEGAASRRVRSKGSQSYQMPVSSMPPGRQPPDPTWSRSGVLRQVKPARRAWRHRAWGSKYWGWQRARGAAAPDYSGPTRRLAGLISPSGLLPGFITKSPLVEIVGGVTDRSV